MQHLIWNQKMGGWEGQWRQTPTNGRQQKQLLLFIWHDQVPEVYAREFQSFSNYFISRISQWRTYPSAHTTRLEYTYSKPKIECLNILKFQSFTSIFFCVFWLEKTSNQLKLNQNITKLHTSHTYKFAIKWFYMRLQKESKKMPHKQVTVH